MAATEKRTTIDCESATCVWKDSFLKFLKLVGESTNDWHPELWEEYGITVEEAREIFKEYEKLYPED